MAKQKPSLQQMPKFFIDAAAKAAINEAFRHIKKDSSQAAQKVKAEILKSFKELLKHPLRHPADKYRLDGDKAFRAYEIYSYRISYRVSEDKKEITVIRIRHTAMNPLDY